MPPSKRIRTAVAAAIVATSGLLAALPVGAETGTITTVAGKSPPGYSGDGGQARDAQMNEPRMLTFDGAGTMYIVDTFNQVVRRVGTDGVITTLAGHSGETGDGGPATRAKLTEPRTMALAGEGAILFTEPKVNRIRRIDANTGIISTFAGTGKAGYSGDGGPATRAMLNFNRGVGVDGAGIVWIADSLNQRIRKVDANGIITTVAGSGKTCYASENNNCGDGGPATAAGFATPRALEFDDAGNLYVADTFNERIRRIDGFAGPVRHPGGVGP